MIYYITPEQWRGIPDDYKKTVGGRRACFICFLTKYHKEPGSTLCFEGEHFKIDYKRPAYTDIEEHNGGHAVQCLESKKAKDFYNSGAVKVYEYKNPDPLVRYEYLRLYAYETPEEYGEGMTAEELEEKLELMAEASGASSTSSL